jgi:hypothetical protein
MRFVRGWRTELGWRRAAFTVVVLVTLGFFGFIAVVLVYPDLIAGLLGHEIAGHIGGHFRSVHHRVHDLTFGFTFGTAAVGVLAQLRAPAKNISGQLMALIAVVSLVLTSALTNSWVFAPLPIFGALILLATILHPTGQVFFKSFSLSRMSRPMLALVIVAAVPLLAFTSRNIGLQRTVINDHAALGHYGFMAAFSLTVIGAGLLASLRPDGWMLTAWITGLLPALLGLISLVYPNLDSSLGPVWALAAIAWGAGFLATIRQLPP